MLIDDHLPAFRWRERHEIDVPAPIAAVDAAMKAVTYAEMPLARMLMAVRSMGGRGLRNAQPTFVEPVLTQLQRSGFLVLGEQPGREIVFGIVGRFWQVCPVHAKLDGPSAFAAFSEPGWVKAAMNLTLDPLGESRTRIATETRIVPTDAAAARRFRLYWAFVRSGSGLVRRAWLRAVARRAREAPPP